MVIRSYLTSSPRVAEENWLHNNIFQSTCIIMGKVCKFVINAGSCKNIVSEEAVHKLGVKIEKHPKPYKLAWLKKGGEVTISQRAMIPFSIGQNYKDQIQCDVVNMDVCHLLLGRPWQYDRRVTHDGRSNTYSFYFNNIKIMLLPSNNSDKTTPTVSNSNLLSLARFEKEMKDSEHVYMLLGWRQVLRWLFQMRQRH